VVGFTNKYGEEFVFLGEGQKLSTTELSFKSGYSDLFKNVGYTGLTQLGISKKVAARYLVTLANY
jgi:hypothetical protein